MKGRICIPIMVTIMYWKCTWGWATSYFGIQLPGFRTWRCSSIGPVAQVAIYYSETKRTSCRAAIGAERVPGNNHAACSRRRGDSAGFLSFFLPNPEKALKGFRPVPASRNCASYWYKIRLSPPVEHLKEMKSIFNLPIMKMKDAPNYRNLEVPQSDAIIKTGNDPDYGQLE